VHLLVEIGVKRNVSFGATLVALQMHYAALCSIKTLGQERHAIDAELLTTFGDADLRFGCSCPWSLGSQAADSNQLGLRPRNQGCHEVSSTTGTGRTEGIAQERIHLYFSR
jgi:hypothetical protein